MSTSRQQEKAAMGAIISDRIRYYRAINRLTLVDLAETVGVLADHICKIQAGKHIPTLWTLCRLRDALELDCIDDLLIPLSHDEREEIRTANVLLAEVRAERARENRREAGRRRRLREKK